ncbi:porin family protein [Pedobacter gandavensis]|uniref:Outer membrane beta-barrel protein n=1 Tax=Pedobacter gandavensis TaxID=2679963 RepID=A0ABR6F222_9SPHI|nr:porin family protein [Pedobacter gandavensis]MBB2151540.1 outer membrane beta-barrel protein [Pedobacter gandavensis]
MKKIILSALFICSSMMAFSQILPSFQFGLKGGVNLTKFSTEGTLKSDNRAGYYGGVWARIGAAGIHLQPEMYISGKNTSLKDPNGFDTNVDFTSLDIPVLVGTKIGAAGVGIRLNTGPVVSFVLSKDQTIKAAATEAFKGKFKDQNFAWQFGAGLDVSKLGIDLRYEQGLTKIGKDEFSGAKKLGLFTLGLAYRLF